MTALLVEAVGSLALVEDLGRPGRASFGLTESGAADRGALRLANRLVGNADGAAGLEVLLGGLVLRSQGDVTVAVTGAPAPLSVNGSPADLLTPIDLGDGDRLSLGNPTSGLRTYVAVAGGIVADPVLGSVSSDPTAGVGPPPLATGQRLSVGERRRAAPPAVDVAAGWGPLVGDLTVRLVLGPRDDWFTDEAVRRLTSMPWLVTTDLDRVGIRLAGDELARSRRGELPSEPLVRGSVQVPPTGRPIVFHADHPTTGGYPVIGVVVDADTDALAQLRPSDRLRFRTVARGW